MTKILEVKRVTGGYVPGVDILRNISLDLSQGEAVGLIGLNGSGKSTLGKAVMNMLPYCKGEIFFDCRPVMHLPTCELSRSGIAMMQQGGQVFRNLSVWENWTLAADAQKDFCYLSELAKMIPLIKEAQRMPQSRMADRLSGGQRHQLALAMSLARKPRLLILDEPSAGLSPKAMDEMYGILQEIRHHLSMTILLIEQNINKAIEFCDRCLLLKQGNVAYHFENKKLSEIEKVMFEK